MSRVRQAPPLPEPPDVPPLPQPVDAATLDCGDRAATTDNRDSEDSDVVVAHVVFRDFANSSVNPTADIPGGDTSYAQFAKAPIHVPPGVAWVVVDLIGDGAVTAWVPAGVWSGDGWVIDDYAAPSLVLDLHDCSTAGGLRDGSVFLGGLVADGEGCVTLRVRTSVMPEGEERRLALGSPTC